MYSVMLSCGLLPEEGTIRGSMLHLWRETIKIAFDISLCYGIVVVDACLAFKWAENIRQS